MEIGRRDDQLESSDSSEVLVLPSLFKATTTATDELVVHVKENVADHVQLDSILSFGRFISASSLRIEASSTLMEEENINNVSKPQSMHCISISMPCSPVEAHKKYHILFRDNNGEISKSTANPEDRIIHSKSAKLPLENHGIDKFKDKRYDSFKTWSGKLERQISNLRGKINSETQEEQTQEIEVLPVERYFDALEGPELDVLRASEEILLPEDKQWPFLLRFPISSFGICLGVSSQAIMWKTLASSESTAFFHANAAINLVLWLTSIALLMIIALIYSLKVILYFEAVRREFQHPVRVNFFFSPWITLLFLALGVPPSVSETMHSSLWYVLMTPIFCLELKIYGQWMSGGERRLSQVANPSNHLSILGNFVGALLGASMGLKEGPLFFFAVGLAHYMVLFVTLYQRLPTNKSLPKELHPIFFLFVAAPSVASLAWAALQGHFDCGARLAYFIAIFLYFSLAVRVNFFRGFRFSMGWWAYTFPMTGAAIATVKYSSVVTNILTQTLTSALCIIATLGVAAMLVATFIHAFVLGDLFPNDIAIAISEKRTRSTARWYRRRRRSSLASNNHYPTYSNSCNKDIESSVNSQQIKSQDSVMDIESRSTHPLHAIFAK